MPGRRVSQPSQSGQDRRSPRCWPASFFLSPALGSLHPLCTRATDSPFKVVDYLRYHIPNSFLIETPEYELTFLDDEHRFHLMPEFYFVESMANRIVLDSPDHEAYDFTKTKADLLVLGSFGKSVFKQNYPLDQVEKYYKKIASIDYYDIYLRRDRSLGRQVKVINKSPSCSPQPRLQ